VTRRFRYSPWDGTQQGFELNALDVMEQLTDDLIYHGDPYAAVRRAMQDGFEDRDGRHIDGLRDLLERLRSKREELLARSELGGLLGELGQRLDDIVATEQAALDHQAATGDAAQRSAAEVKQLELAMLPDGLGERLAALREHSFESPAAQQQFEDLLAELRAQLMSQVVDQISQGMSSMSPQDLTRLKDMMAELNRMLEQRAAGEEPDFDGFMERYGDLFPEQLANLDELLEAMARRMAAMSALLNSMTPEQRAQLQSLSDQLLDDMDLRWQLEQLGESLRGAFPSMGWDSSQPIGDVDPLDLANAIDAMEDLGALDELAKSLSRAVNPGALADVDLDRARQLLGRDGADSIQQLSKLSDMLSESGLVEMRDGELVMTPAALRRLGQNALAQLFRNLDRDLLGGHRIDRLGVGHERSTETKPYEFGEPFNLDIQRTLRNAVLRQAGEGRPLPVELVPGDFEVEQTEQSVRTATVLLLDMSLSMPMRGNFLPAKKVALALHSLISSQYPRDYLGLVCFNDVAREVRISELPSLGWRYEYGTNMAQAIAIARRLLAREHGTKQIVMITDGEPTAHPGPDGEPIFHYPPVQETVDATLAEVIRATREGIVINTFMLDADDGLRHFVERMTELNRGRAFFTTPETLGDFVLVDFIEQRRRRVGAR
jgi:uncharacterized protein with von Willebrand factor type A (vWA) domain